MRRVKFAGVHAPLLEEGETYRSPRIVRVRFIRSAFGLKMRDNSRRGARTPRPIYLREISTLLFFVKLASAPGTNNGRQRWHGDDTWSVGEPCRLNLKLELCRSYRLAQSFHDLLSLHSV